MTIQVSRAFFLKNTSLPKSFVKHYVNLTKSFKRHEYSKAKKYKGYRIKDTLMADKQILRLDKFGQKAYYQLMKTKLQWEYEEHLLKTILSQATSFLHNKPDSAFYFFTLGIYFKDSLNELLARKLGFVWSDGKGNELPDWKKMNNIKFNPWALESISAHPYKIDINITDVWNAFIPYFEKAIELDKKEFFYMIEMILPLIRFGDEKTLQEKIIQYKDNYSPNEQKWLAERMNESISRRHAAESVKSNK